MNRFEAPIFMSEPEPERYQNGELTFQPEGPYRQGYRTEILVPEGEMKEVVLSFFKSIGLEFEDGEDKMPVKNLPIDLIVTDPNKIARTVGNDMLSNSPAIGIVTSDVLVRPGNYSLIPGEELPVQELVEDAPANVSFRLIQAQVQRYESRIGSDDLKTLSDLEELTYVALKKKGMI